MWNFKLVLEPRKSTSLESRLPSKRMSLISSLQDISERQNDNIHCLDRQGKHAGNIRPGLSIGCNWIGKQFTLVQSHNGQQLRLTGQLQLDVVCIFYEQK